MTSLDPVPDDARGRVVVALDGSPSSVGALRSASRLAAALGAPVEVVTVWHRSDSSGLSLGGPLDPEPEAMISSATAAQTTAIAEVFGSSPPAALSRTILEGPTVRTLLAHSAGAEMLVLGSRGRGGFAGLLLGSVSAACAAHAATAVLVCRPERLPAEQARPASEDSGAIVVGVDGTEASIGALRQGAGFAASLQLPLHAICAWTGTRSAREARAILRAASTRVFAGDPPQGFRMSEREGTPEAVLGHASEHARMLIIGHSGSGAPTGPQRSVSSSIALRTRSPIVIFHPGRVADPDRALLTSA